MLIVTGANGFIGSALVWDLNQRGREDILCVDHISPKEEADRPLPYLKYQAFCKPEEVKNYLETHAEKVDAIFHMGACSSTTETNEDYLRENNTEYTKVMWNLAIQHGCPFIYASSAAIYGDGQHGFDDKTPTSTYTPLNLYGWSKHWFDEWASQQSLQPKSWYGLRFFNVYGPNEYHKQNMASVVFKAFLQIKDTGKLKLFKSHNSKYEDGKQLRDFVYVKDVTRWMIELFESNYAENGIYNMGYGVCRTWLELAENVFKSMNIPTNIEWIDIPENIRNQYQYFTEAKMNKWEDQGLSAPQWSLESGIKDYLSNYLMTDSRHMRTPS
ncbi:MAG: ADP-glyceromanno-heptose 6-epimerase [Bdellovibrionaceae bacterium]|nr:ADP-glyceromanno-heptose 6-epimerase [Pseudobdellovibrionaceae bacterium]